MSFIKKHYEKILLGAVLFGLFAVLLYLPFRISQDRQNLRDIVSGIIRTKGKPLPPLDMSALDDALTRVQSSFDLEDSFEKTNRLFNPMQWQRTPDGRWIENRTGKEIGPDAVRVTKIVPLYYILRLESVEPATSFSPARYVVSIEQQDAPIAPERRPRRHYLSVGEHDAALSLISVTGPADNPQVVVQVIASGDQVSLTMKKPYSTVTGHAADLFYPPENKHWYDQRVGAMINLDRNDYKVVVIEQNEVVLFAQTNQRKTTLQYQP
ncbi:MAG TPA: hypothetical protein VME24_07920 [Alphaproteobacteria bacterium]|nr:hypothetical protein [Alphaproteobacteria bacterium]